MRIGDGPIIAADAAAGHRRSTLWQASLDIAHRVGAARLAITHFGAYDDPAAHLADLREVLDRLGAWRARPRRRRVRAPRARWITERVGPERAAAYFQGMPPDALYPGLARYWAKWAS